MKYYIVPLSEEEAFYGFQDVARELITCKDCKYCKVYEVFGHTLPLCNRIKTMMADALEEDDYCSKAVREEE